VATKSFAFLKISIWEGGVAAWQPPSLIAHLVVDPIFIFNGK
jgi:hypothetical protein